MSDYLQAFKGKFTSTLRWHDLDNLWQALRALNHGQWYIYVVGEAPPVAPASTDELEKYISEIDKLLRHEHQEDYCGIVYADSLQQPGMVKIFDPNNLGVSCGFSEHPPLPGWVLSVTPPVDLPMAYPPPANRRHWWQSLFGA
jgi:hypothetical protein